jgi:ABC-2 type transport system permease protein
MGSNGAVAPAWCCGLLLFSVVLAIALYRRRTGT